MRYTIALLLAVIAGATSSPSQEYKPNLALNHPAIQYFERPTADPVRQLIQELQAGKVQLTRASEPLGFLPDLLKYFGIEHNSQMLVFSKTSFQAPKISPDNPRAIYFNDNVAVAYVRGTPGLEVAAMDPTQGPVFYEVSADQAGKPVFDRNEVCLRCHQGPNTFGIPGIYIGSVIPGPSGAPLRDESAIITDHRTAFKDRWGGWYVNAKSGEQQDRANAVASNPADPATLVRDSQQNLTTLIGKFRPAGYLNATSDIVALMTFEHQTQMTNYITRVGWESRMSMDPNIEEFVEYMLFSAEAPLKEPIEGVSKFSETFPKQGPRDKRGRSLRDFDLKTRIFRYPLSYLIYSAGFDALPGAVRDRIYRRLFEVLAGKDNSPKFAHIAPADRIAILEILRDTKKNLPDYWTVPAR